MHGNTKDIHFGKRAAKYDGLEGKLSRKFYRLLLEQIELKPGDNVLDVGCGTGTMLRKMADLCTINGYGIDVAEDMISQAQKKCPKMLIQVAKCDRTPFANQTFDVITTCMAYHHFADKKAFAKEVARILKPGGYLYITDPRFPFLVRKAVNGTLKHLRIAGYFGTPREISANFQDYGFVLDAVTVDGFAQMVQLRLQP